MFGVLHMEMGIDGVENHSYCVLVLEFAEMHAF